MKKNQTKTLFYPIKTISVRFPKRIKTIAAFLVCLFMTSALMAQSVSNGRLAPSPKSPWEIKGLTEEIQAKRSRTAKHFVGTGNKIEAFISPSSIHYLDANNVWQDISTTLVSNSGANAQTHPYMAVENSVKTWFPANPFADYILMSSKEGDYKEKIKAIHFLDANKQVISSLPLSVNVSAQVNNNQITYTGFHPQLALNYSMGNDGRKFDLVIQSAAFLSAIPAGAQFMSIEEEFVSADNNTRIEKANNEVLVFVGSTNVFRFDQPYAYDSNPAVDILTENSKATVGINLNGSTATLKSSFSIAWLKNTARQFPVHLDPTVNYYPTLTTFWTGYQTSSTAKTSGYIRVTTGFNRGWGKFDLSTLPSGATVTQADYYGYHYTTTGTPNKICEIRSMGTLDPVTATGAAISGQIGSGTLYNGNYTYGGSTYGWNMGTLGGTALSDVAAAAGNWIGLGFLYSSGSTTFMYHYGVNVTTSTQQYLCYLEVTYFTVPCTTVPGANSAVTPTYAICPGASANVFLANTYSVGGITYQWQSSTVSPVGPFTAVPGATNSALSTPTLNVNTWFTAVITCTAAAGNVTATASEVMVQATTIDTIPYFESFEGIISENTLPNCSWNSASLGSTALTYTGSNTLGRVPLTGTSFASFYYSPAGPKAFFSNGLQLVAGVTYSASLWYVTEYYGYNNWSDLSILVGTSQSTTGMVQVASSNGPAVSNVYKPLSGTFSVATSGVYYLAIQANGTASGAQYLTWDDLRVEIPCSLNAPAMGLTASSTSICAGDPVNLIAAGADSYSWSNGASGSVINPSPAMTTTYIVTGTSTLTGCTSVASETIFVNNSPSVFILADNPTSCAGSPVTLSALGDPANHIWSNAATGPVTVVSPTVTTTYTVIATNALGCSNTNVQTINVNDLPTIAASSSMPDMMCAGETANLVATGAVTYQWVSGTSSNLYVGSSINITPTATEVFTVTGTDANGCEGVSTFVQNVDACAGLSEFGQGSLNLSVFPNPTDGEFTLNFSSGSEKTIMLTDVTGREIISKTTSEQKVKMSVENLAAGIYYVLVKSDVGSEVVKVVKQ